MKNKDIKILLVDDDADILEIVGFNLEAEGYQVLKAPNGKEGVRLAKKEKPHLIILDVMMPEMDWCLRELTYRCCMAVVSSCREMLG